MLLKLSVVIVLLLTAYCIYYTYQRREQLTCMAGMMIAMTVGMMSSTALGLMLGILFIPDLTPPTIIAVTVGLVAGYLAGKPISLMAAMDGMMAGMMGGMMGGMLGVMLLPATTTMMLLFVDILFIIMMLLLLKLIDQETAPRKKENEKVARRSFLSRPVIVIAGVLMVGIFLFSRINGFNVGKALNEQPVIQAEVIDGVQNVTITASDYGYEPGNIELKSGIPAEINFKTEDGAGCTRYLISKNLGIHLLQNGDNFISLEDPQPGTYEFSCRMGMYWGAITVK